MGRAAHGFSCWRPGSSPSPQAPRRPSAPARSIALRDVHWQHKQPTHPLIGQVLKGDQPITIASDACTRTPLQQMIVEIRTPSAAAASCCWARCTTIPNIMLCAATFSGRAWIRSCRQTVCDLLPCSSISAPASKLGSISFIATPRAAAACGERRDLLRELDWKASGWPAAEMFYPLFDAALRAKKPIFPGNAVRERMRLLVRGQDQPTDEEVARIKLAQAMPQPLLDALTTELEGSHCGALPAAAIPGMSLAQRYTDAHLAEALVRAAEKHNGAFLLAGNGHVRTDRAVPWYVRRLAPQRKLVAVMFLEVAEGNNDASAYLTRTPDGAVAADYVMFTPRQQRPDPCEKMRQGKP